MGGFTPSFTYDSRDSMFTPLRGTFVEALLGVFSPALGGDDEFQRLQVTAIQYVPLYEIARKYGIHMGLDLAFAPENTAVYVQVGSAWARP